MNEMRDHMPLEMDGTVAKSKSFCGNAEPKIVRCVIEPSTSMFESPKVMVKYEGHRKGDEFVCLFDYYPDEISFTPAEFIGLTAKEARTVKFEKDKAYIQS
jgi:hypothetical protein